MVEKIQIGPYSLTLLPLYDGPLFEVEEGGESEALATLLNHSIVNRPENGLAVAIKEGREGSDAITYVSPASNADEDQALRTAWAERTGESLDPGSVARVGVMGRNDTLPVSWAALQHGIAELQAIRASWCPDSGPWLFTRPTKSPFGTPQDFELIKKLEEEAAEIDKIDFQAEVGQELITLIERRREFLRNCQEAGIFANDYPQARQFWLNHSFAERLLTLRQASVELRSWDFLTEEEEPPDGPICLDYIRHQLWPPGEDGQTWARAALQLLTPPLEGEQGVIVERIGGSTTHVWWRRDGDRPALLAIDRGRVSSFVK